MKKTVLFSALALTASAIADGDMVAAQMKSDMQSNGTKPMPSMVTLTSARPESDNGWYLFADALYWHADVGNTDWAFRNNNTANTNGVERGANHTLDFKWSWGFRVGLGANMDHDEWDTNIYYTWFHTKNSNAIGTSGATQTAVDNQGSVGRISGGSIDWRIHYSMFDWELGRWYYVSKSLALRPHIGIKGGWIHQKVDRRFTINSTSSASADLKNNFWGVGAAGGANTSWILGHVGTHNFTMFGDFAGALMYGHFNVTHNETVTTNNVVVDGKNPQGLNRNLAVPVLQAMFGLGWDTSFNRDRCHFGLKVGYEFQYWFRQNQMLNMKNGSPANTVQYWRNADDLSLQGLTIDFRFDF
jgi:hypothetical protein